MSVAALDDAAHDLLDAAVALLDLNVASGAPERQVVTHGTPPDDCDQIAVWATGINEETTAPLSPTPQVGHRALAGRLNLPTFKIRVVRCMQAMQEGGQPVTVATMEEASAIAQQDAWVLWNGLMAMVRANTLFDREKEFLLDSATAVDAAGGVGAWEISLRVQLDGYTPTLPT